MWQGSVMFVTMATILCAQDGQQGSRTGWPCVAGRAVDPSYLDASESTGGQLFLFQKNEVAHASVVMSASFTHPATVLRAVCHLSGTRDFEFPVDSSTDSILVLASLQCRSAILVSRPNGEEMTAANSALSIDLQAGKILRVDSPESGKWRVRLTGTGLFVVSVLAKTSVTLGGVAFLTAGEGAVRLPHPLLGVRQILTAHLPADVSNVKFQMAGPTGDPIADLDATAPAEGGAWRMDVTPQVERLRILVTGTDSTGRPFLRTHPVLFRAERAR